MKNKAKCKLCNTIIESFHASDYVSCKCGEISLDGGDALRCYANDWNNFLRVDDKGNEIIVKVEKSDITIPPVLPEKLGRKELVNMLEDMIKSYERLPERAMNDPVTHYDLVSSLMLLLSILRSE